MKLLVKIFLVLNLVLCGLVLAVSVKTFRDREIIKARSVIHRQQMQVIAEKLLWGQSVPWESDQERKSGAFVLPNPTSMEEFGSFTSQLGELTSLAEQRVNQLSVQFEELSKVEAELEEARTNLAARVQELADARSQVASMEGSLENSQTSLREINTQIGTLTRENESLKQQVENLDAQITDQQTLISQVERELELRTTERDRARELLEACLRPETADGGQSGDWSTQTARILAVEPEWNYVVINKGEVDTLPMFLEGFVHRGDTFIGKIRVMQVDQTVAIAEILADTMVPGMTIETGDTLFF